jgi:hypothetical protein
MFDPIAYGRELHRQRFASDPVYVERKRASGRAHYARHNGRLKVSALARYHAGPGYDPVRAKLRYATDHRYRLKIILREAKKRAVARGIEFNLRPEDIVIPEVCPVLGISLKVGGGRNPGNPSLDRFDNSLGYTKDNVRVISLRANMLKTNATVDELKRVLAYVLGDL